MAESVPILDSQENPVIKRRKEITQFVELRDLKWLRQLGIIVVDDKQDSNDTCFETAFPPSLYPKNILRTIILNWDVVEEPKVGDAAIYLTSNGNLTHVGRAVEQGRVISRWGYGGLICEHDPLDIPLFTGVDLEVVWYREPK